MVSHVADVFLAEKKVKPEEGMILAGLIMFAPWTLLFAPAWNPSFLPILSVPFFVLLEKVLNHQDRKTALNAFGIGLLIQLAFQLHLSAALLVLCVLVVIFRIPEKPKFLFYSFVGFITGAFFDSLDFKKTERFSQGAK